MQHAENTGAVGHRPEKLSFGAPLSPSKRDNRLLDGGFSQKTAGELKTLQPLRASKELPALAGLNSPEPGKEGKKKRKKKKGKERIRSSKDGLVGYPTSVVTSDEALPVGTKVEARYGGGGDYYGATVQGIQRDNNCCWVYDLAYDDGDKEDGVKRLRIRKPGEKQPRLLEVGMRCEARHHGGKRSYAGVIDDVVGEDTYAVKYDDDDYEATVDRGLIYVQCGEAARIKDSNTVIVSPRIPDNQQQPPQQIAHKSPSPSIAFAKDLGLTLTPPTQKKVQIYEPRPEEATISEASDTVPTTTPRSSVDVPFKSNTAISAKPIVVASARTDGASAGISVGAKEPTSAFTVGTRIEGRFGGGTSFFPGVITAVRQVMGDGSDIYDLVYDDGDKEDGVKRLRIRKPGEKQPRLLEVGMRCEARHHGGKRCYDGVIDDVIGEDTYAVKYDDGDYEAAVTRDLIYVKCQSRSSKDKTQSSKKIKQSQQRSEERQEQQNETQVASLSKKSPRPEVSHAKESTLQGERGATCNVRQIQEVPPDVSLTRSSAGKEDKVPTSTGNTRYASIEHIFRAFDRDGDGKWGMADWNAMQWALGQSGFSDATEFEAVCRALITTPESGFEDRHPETGERLVTVDALVAAYDQSDDLEHDLACLANNPIFIAADTKASGYENDDVAFTATSGRAVHAPAPKMASPLAPDDENVAFTATSGRAVHAPAPKMASPFAPDDENVAFTATSGRALHAPAPKMASPLAPSNDITTKDTVSLSTVHSGTVSQDPLMESGKEKNKENDFDGDEESFGEDAGVEDISPSGDNIREDMIIQTSDGDAARTSHVSDSELLEAGDFALQSINTGSGKVHSETTGEYELASRNDGENDVYQSHSHDGVNANIDPAMRSSSEAMRALIHQYSSSFSIIRCSASENNDQLIAITAVLQLIACLVSAAWIAWATDRYDGCFPDDALGGGVSFPEGVFVGSGAVPALAAMASAARPDMRVLTGLAALTVALAAPLRLSVIIEAEDEGCKSAVPVLVWDAFVLPLGLLFVLLRSFCITSPIPYINDDDSVEEEKPVVHAHDGEEELGEAPVLQGPPISPEGNRHIAL